MINTSFLDKIKNSKKIYIFFPYFVLHTSEVKKNSKDRIILDLDRVFKSIIPNREEREQCRV